MKLFVLIIEKLCVHGKERTEFLDNIYINLSLQRIKGLFGDFKVGYLGERCLQFDSLHFTSLRFTKIENSTKGRISSFAWKN
jgi:hypothetical protein